MCELKERIHVCKSVVTINGVEYMCAYVR
jgi:hypothetical protein